MTENKPSRIRMGKLISVRDCYRIWPASRRESLDQDPLTAPQKRLPSAVKALAVLAAVAIPLSVVQPTTAIAPVVSAAERMGQGAAKAFVTSELAREVAGDAVLPPEQRAAGIPLNTAAGWDLPTTDGRTVQLVPPGRLGAGEVTVAGQVVYPDAGAGYDVLAENTAIGRRMVTRISGPEKTRTVTMFVRTPADTVMLAHTNGFLTVNQATAQAETVAMFAPSEVRDSRGALVPSAYITQQLQPNLYLLSQVISPDSSTAWPVYADPFGIDIPNPITAAKNAVASVANAGEQLVNKAVEVAAPAVKTFAAANAQLASQAWSGIKAGANYVKENPLEFAQIVGGTALVASGVGSGFGASLIVSGASGLVNKAAEANPDNKWLQAAAVATEAATYIGPGGITGKGLKEAANLAKEGGEKLITKFSTTKADDAVKAVVPTPKPQLADEVAAAGKTPEVPANPAATPKTPNAPPGEVPGGEHSWALPPSPADARLSTNITDRVPLRKDVKADIRNAADIDPATKKALDPNLGTPIKGKPDFGHKPGYEEKTTNQMVEKYGLSRREKLEWSNVPGHYQLEQAGPNRSHLYENPRSPESMYREYQSWVRENIQTNPRLAQDPTARRRAGLDPLPQQRPTGAAQQRQVNAARGQAVTNGQRAKAVDGAHQNGNTAAGNKPSSSSTASTNTGHHDGSGGGSHSKSNGGSKSNKGNGKGNRAKRSRTHHK